MKDKLNIASYRGAILDVDGTMLDSMLIWNNVASEYLKSRNRTPRPSLNEELRKLGGHEIPRFFQKEYDIVEPAETILSSLNQLLENYYFYVAPLKPGVTRALDILKNSGLSMSIATATDRRLIEPALERCGVFDYFGRIFTCPEELTSKRSPDIYIRAADFMCSSIDETLVFEDALYAIVSAKRAGFTVVAVYDEDADDQKDEIMSYCDYYLHTWDDIESMLA
ncbi:MAG: HAD family hydrolase [Oscillospiraceae bacterium]|nr:HAD family hydrolase [Oscillospiraceae bacterium]